MGPPKGHVGLIYLILQERNFWSVLINGLTILCIKDCTLQPGPAYQMCYLVGLICLVARILSGRMEDHS